MLVSSSPPGARACLRGTSCSGRPSHCPQDTGSTLPRFPTMTQTSSDLQRATRAVLSALPPCPLCLLGSSPTPTGLLCRLLLLTANPTRAGAIPTSVTFMSPEPAQGLGWGLAVSRSGRQWKGAESPYQVTWKPPVTQKTRHRLLQHGEDVVGLPGSARTHERGSNWGRVSKVCALRQCDFSGCDDVLQTRCHHRRKPEDGQMGPACRLFATFCES